MEDLFFRRRSIRKFIKDKNVEDEKLEYILKSAMYAPSANNTQNWEFIIVKNKNTFNTIMNYHPYSKMLETANIAIVVCGDISSEAKERYWIQNCSAAIENMLLSATIQGLGSIWISVHPREDRVENTRKLFNIPEHINPLGIVAIGYIDENVKLYTQDRFDKNKIHYESY